MLRSFLPCLAALLALGVLPGLAEAKPGKPERPLVYVFVLDGLDRDAVEDDGTAPFLGGLIDDRGGNGAYFPQSRSVMVAETNPNHASMVTGAYPKRHGIVGNEFATYGAGPDEDSCAATEKPAAAPTPTSGESPTCLDAETAFTALERQLPERRATTAMIMGKPKLARLLATSDAGTPYDADHIWSPCDDDEPYCEDVPTNPITGYALDDSVVMDEVIRTTRDKVEDGGQMRRPNFTFANFPQVDSAGHATGRSGAPYSTAVGLADDEVERFVANQKQLGIWERTVMIVVSDHSMDNTPQLAKISIDDIFDMAGIPASSYEVVGNGGAAHIYLTERLAPGRFQLLRRMRAALESSSGVDDAFFRSPNPADGGRAHTLARAARGWGLGSSRTGDVVVTARPGVGVLETSSISSFPFNPLPGNHGGTFTRDNFFLVAGGGGLVRKATSKRKVTNANVAATAVRLLGAKPPRDAQAGIARQAFKKQQLKKLTRRR